MPFAIGCVAALSLYLGMRIGQYQSTSTVPVYRSEQHPQQGDPGVKGSSNFVKTGSDFSSNDASGKLTYLFDLLQDRYVDTLNLQKLVEAAIPSIIEELDPHSAYIPAADLQSVNEQLEGSFSGIGVQFNIQQDTVMVIQVVSGGPSEKLGIMPGDRIVTVNDSAFTGPQINNDKVLKTLRGPKGTKVTLGIRRQTASELLKFDITRGDIPLHSVVAEYMLEGNIGYIKVDNFGRNTYDEFFTALIALKSRGAKGYLLDFRGNGGGYLEVCCQMVNEFLPEGSLIVYTEGLTSSRRDVTANGKGNFLREPVVVLIDEWSASASEIFSGAIQDNDRGTIVGRRSFGKGLVQQQFDLYDGSALRLTIARYYTPSGRCIQKPYSMGQGADYAADLSKRYEHGEFYSRDSIHLDDSLKYSTLMGRPVYAGGGIMPDTFVPSDTTDYSPYYYKCVNKGVCYSFAFQYSDRHRNELSEITSLDQVIAHLKQSGVMNDFYSYARKEIGAPKPEDLKRSSVILERLVYAYILRQCKDDNYFYQEFNSTDKTYLEGLRILREGTAFPVALEEKK